MPSRRLRVDVDPQRGLAQQVIAEAAFEALLGRHSGDPVLLLVDERLHVLRAGPQAEGLTDRAPDQLRGLSLIAAFGSAPLDAVARAAASEGTPATGEAQLGGPLRQTFQVDAVPIPGAGLVLALHNITHLRRVERIRRDFVANISHELRTPITSIKLLAETLQAASEDEAMLPDFANQIASEVDHLAQLVDELLDLSMIESGEVRLSIEAVDPAEVVRSLAERIGPVAERRRISVQVLPHATSDQAVRAAADFGRLGQALLNLAHNAVKFSHAGGEVRLGWAATGDRVRFVVADDGIGISTAHQARIFERFYKVDRARSRVGSEDGLGTGSAGLGLAIVRHIADAHGGSAGVESVEGAGSTFWIEVPRASEP
jgi:two-component system, OmpR family, phosphate regulon sensor histidine kinase PhoR